MENNSDLPPPYYEDKFVDPSDPDAYFAAHCVCKGCGIKPDPTTPESALRGTHYHCDAPECVGYDLCLGCWERGTTSLNHTLSHEMSLCHGNIKIREGTSTQPMPMKPMIISPYGSPFVSPSASPSPSPKASPATSPRATDRPSVFFSSPSTPPSVVVQSTMAPASPASAPAPAPAPAPAEPVRSQCVEPGCAFFGTSATANRCSSCFRAWSAANPAAVSEPVTDSAPPPSSAAVASSSDPAAADAAAPATPKKKRTPAERRARQEKKKRCHNCKKKVGIHGLFCECGFKFCTACRLPETHDCDFDHRSLARERLAMANQVVSPAKVQKI